MVISRRQIISWILIVVSVAYIAYFLRVPCSTPASIEEEE